jgi:hypothetical protein
VSAVAERVAAGAAFMDEHDPGWWRADVEQAIDLDRLLMDQPDRCILGQRCPLTVLAAFCHTVPDDEFLDDERWRSYTAYAIELSGIRQTSIFGPAGLARWGDAHGFSNSDESGGWEGYPSLTAEWKRVILARREAGAQ